MLSPVPSSLYSEHLPLLDLLRCLEKQTNDSGRIGGSLAFKTKGE